MLYFDQRPVEMHLFANREVYIDTAFLAGEDRALGHTVGCRFEGNDDLMSLGLLKGQLDDLGFASVALDMPFFPYSTMDHTDGSRPLSLKYAARWINGMGFSRVRVMEPHSTVLAAMVDRVEIVNESAAIANSVLEGLPDGWDGVVCFPDNGAEKRYLDHFQGRYATLTFQKKRDFSTGNLVGMRCVDSTEGLRTGKNQVAVIIDDLCRSGRTFMECGTLLRALGIRRVILCVTHLEAGVFESGLLDGTLVDAVYATDSCLPAHHPEHDRLHLKSVFGGGGE